MQERWINELHQHSYGAEETAGQDGALDSEDAFKRPVRRREIGQTVSPGTKVSLRHMLIACVVSDNIGR